jgi:phosphatidylinositol 4-kinase A
MEKPADDQQPVVELSDLKDKMNAALSAIREKRNTFSIQDLKRLLFRCASSLIRTAKVTNLAIYSLWKLTYLSLIILSYIIPSRCHLRRSHRRPLLLV